MSKLFVAFFCLISLKIYAKSECAKALFTRNEFCQGDFAYNKDGKLVLLLKKDSRGNFQTSIIGKNSFDQFGVSTSDLFNNDRKESVKGPKVLLGDLGKRVISDLTTKQISAISEDQIRTFKPEQIQQLKIEQIQAFTTEQMKTFGSLIQLFDEDQLNAFIEFQRHLFQGISNLDLSKLKPKLKRILKDVNTSSYVKYGILKRAYEPKPGAVICFVKTEKDLYKDQAGVTTSALKEIFIKKDMIYDGIIRDFNFEISENDFQFLKSEIRKNRSLEDIFEESSFWEKAKTLGNFKERIKANIKKRECHTLIFPGGEDINKNFYQFLTSDRGLPKLLKGNVEETSIYNDLLYFISIYLAKKMNKSIISFCRGFQALGVYFGGKLIAAEKKLCDLTEIDFIQNPPVFGLSLSGKERKELMFCHTWYLSPFPKEGKVLASYQRGREKIPALAEYFTKTGFRFFGTQGHPEGFFSQERLKYRSQFGKVLFMELLYNAGLLQSQLGQ